MKFSEKEIDTLRKRVQGQMSPKRFFHTCEVEKMADRLCQIYLPEKSDIMRVAALLHDVTKECSTERHIEIAHLCGVEFEENEIKAPKTLHAMTAAMIIPVDYPSFADQDVIRAVRYHTTGRENMSIEEKILYLADYIDMSRNFEDCVKLREYFFSVSFNTMTQEMRYSHLATISQA